MAHIYNNKEIKIDESGQYCTSLPCHTCKKTVALSAVSCPHCGETDPFYFQEYGKLIKKHNRYLVILILVALVLCIKFFSHGWVGGVIMIVVAIIVGGALSSYRDNELYKFKESVKGNFNTNSTDISTLEYYLHRINKQNS
ncbi:MAG: hypothetical protein LBK94_03680 [Prevotellaceae bacterium]|jgi:hypothetical protein|nr:hypothetical protein [Prevotellaceae bacterium]